MSLITIYKGFNSQLATLTPIDTVHEGQTYIPTADIPYIELYLKPAIEDNVFLNQVGFESKGFFQITLSYPSSGGIGALLTKVEEMKTLFKSKFSFKQDNLTISILKDLEVKNLGLSGDRLVYAIRINYKTLS